MDIRPQDQSAGFGTSSLMGAGDSQVRQALLQSAFDAGIRHFDTAHSYGMGRAESELGIFLAKHRGELTVTTKYGIALPPTPVAVGERILGRIAQTAPGALRKNLQRFLKGRGETRYERFSPQEVQAGIHGSLQKLGVERIDYFLLHEVRGADAVPEGLLSVLKEAQSKGQIGSFGLSGQVSAINAVAAKLPELGSLVQFENSVACRQIESLANKSARMFTYRSLHETFFAWSKALASDEGRRKSLETRIGMSLATDSERAVPWLRFARTNMPGVTVLFSSRSPDHIRSNMTAFRQGPLSQEQADALIEDYRS